MLKIYDKEVFVIELEEFRENAEQMLKNITENPDYKRMVFLLKTAGKIFAAAKLENLDFSLVEQADMYIFSELEEYTYALVCILSKKFPSKPIYFLDGRLSYFPELENKVKRANSVFEIEGASRERCLWVISDGRIYQGIPLDYYTNVDDAECSDLDYRNAMRSPSDYFYHIYSSVQVMKSMLWCSVRESFGEKNRDKVIFLADFSGGSAGLGDYVMFLGIWRRIAKQRGWSFVVNLCHKPNQYLMSESENMWDYFFESMSDMPLDEVYESASVISAHTNGISLTSHGLPYTEHGLYRAMGNPREVIQFMKFNQETRIKIDEWMPEILKTENRVLGVILRGTDFRPEVCKDTASLDKMLKKCRFIMDLYGYSHIFLATEDLEYYEKTKQEFGDQCLAIDQKRAYHDYRIGHKTCAELLAVEDGREFGRKYLAIVQSLANCKALLSNMYNNTTRMAEGLNDSKYEYFEVVTP